MPTRLIDDRPSHDPLGFSRDNIDYLARRLPRNYASDVCRCQACVTAWCQSYDIQGYDPANYRPDASTLNRRWALTAFAYLGMTQPEDHPRRPSRWSSYAQETPLPSSFTDLINHPLRFMLRRSGRVWSAEVECNDIDYTHAASVLGVSSARYSTRPDRACIVASPDATVDAEIKISCMRDGSLPHADMAKAAYATLVRNGATCAFNAGHHVHIDGTRLADLGTDTTEQVMRAVFQTASVCRTALLPLAASGYSKHRGSSTSWNQDRMLTSRQAIHASRLWYAARSATDNNATIEYRLPNATLSPLRAQSFIAIPLGILDFAERAVLDDDVMAAKYYEQVQDRLAHANAFDELTATQFLIDALRLSKDSKRCLALAAYTSPSVAKEARVMWENATENFPRIDSLFEQEVQRIARSSGRTLADKSRTRDSSGRFVSSDEQERRRIEAAYQLVLPQPSEDGSTYDAFGDEDEDYDEEESY